jgi:hypothetical protein
MTNLSVAERFGTACMDPDDSDRLRDEVRALLQRGEKVCLDFTGVSTVTAPFLNEVIGSLHGEFPADFLGEHLKWQGLDEAGDSMARLLRERAIWFFAQPEEVRGRLVDAAFHPLESR